MVAADTVAATEAATAAATEAMVADKQLWKYTKSMMLDLHHTAMEVISKMDEEKINSIFNQM